MSVRLMLLSDHPQLEQLWEPEHMESSLEALTAMLNYNPTSCFVYEIEGRIVAAACGLYNGRHGMISAVATLPSERGNGYARMVMEAVIEALKVRGAQRIRLAVVHGNDKAIHLYKKMGFEIFDSYYMGLK